MEWLAAISSLLDALAWPIAAAFMVVFVSLQFKDQIRMLINRIRTISHRALTLELDGVPRFQDDTGSTALVASAEINDRADDAIQRDPRAAVIEAWLRFELAAVEVLDSRGIPARPRSPTHMIRELNSRQLLRGNLYEILTELRNIRNRAAHDLDLAIESHQAREYVERMEQAIVLLRANANT